MGSSWCSIGCARRRSLALFDRLTDLAAVQDVELAEAIALLRGWADRGAHRLVADRDGAYEEQASERDGWAQRTRGWHLAAVSSGGRGIM